MSFCLKHLLLSPCSYVTLSLKTHYFVFKDLLLCLSTRTQKKEDIVKMSSM